MLDEVADLYRSLLDSLVPSGILYKLALLPQQSISDPMHPLVHASLLWTFSWVLWNVLRKITAKHPLAICLALRRNPFYGVRFMSIFWSTCYPHEQLHPAGNFKQFFNTQSWTFHRNLVDQYGGVVRIYGTFGVSGSHFNIAGHLSPRLQGKQLYIADSKYCTMPL
jgi:hypothetical protein